MKRKIVGIILMILFSPMVFLSAQNGNVVTGTVKEQLTGGGLVPVPGVTVMLDGTLSGTVTDETGTFTIEAPAGATLVFSSLGYEEQKVGVSGRSRIDVVLRLETESIDELVFVGYGMVRKSDLVSSVTSVKPEDMKTYPAINAAEMLSGKAAGVQVKSSSGAPGSVPSITIRGSRSISASNSPLFVIDGSISSDTEFAMISSDDIESIEILKDAASQSIYGARASDGVILVTTKRGKEGDAKISYNAFAGVQHLTRNFDLYSGDEWLRMRAEGLANDRGIYDAYTLSVSEIINDPMMIDVYKTGNYVDWEKEMFRDAVYHSHELGIRGGTEKLKAAASLSYLDQDGVVRFNSGYKRLSARFNLDWQARKWLKMGINSSFGWTDKDIPSGSWYTFLVRTPLAQIYDENGEYSAYANSKDRNPLYTAQHDTHNSKTNNYRINGFAEISLLPGLSYRLNASYYNRSVEEGRARDSKYPGGGSTATLENDFTISTLVENIVNYTVPMPEGHRLSFTAVQSADTRLSKGLGYSVQNLPVDKDWNFIANGEATELIRDYGENNLLSFMLRAQYSFRDKYLLTASIRRDGSSRFGAENKWGSFPSVAAAWRIGEEEFMKDAVWLNSLKLRASYGIVGNQNGIGNYTTLGLSKSWPGEFGDVYWLGYLPGNELSNKRLRWEQSATANFGVDFSLWDDRVSGTVEYYDTHTTDLLVTRSLNSALGYTSMLDNLGETKSNGVDLSLNADLLRSKDWNWSMSLNYSHYHNEIVKIDDAVDENGKPLSQPGNNWIVGAPVNIYYDYEKEGIYQYEDFDADKLADGTYIFTLKNTIDTDGDGVADSPLQRDDVVQPGSVKIRDLDGDGKITINDRRVYKRDPNFTLSLSSTLSWHGFDLFMDWYAVKGGYVLNPILYDEDYGGNLRGSMNGCRVDYWTPYNPSDAFPRPLGSGEIPYLKTCAYQDASYLRLRTLSIGYTLPRKVTSALNMDKLRFYATATNLLTLTDVKSYSPEVMASSYPETQQFVFGVNLSF